MGNKLKHVGSESVTSDYLISEVIQRQNNADKVIMGTERQADDRRRVEGILP